MSRSIPILMYHLISPADPARYAPYRDIYEINSVHPDAFEAQMGLLARRGYQTVSLDELLEHREHGEPLPERSFVITFDDGFQTTADYAVPVMRRYGFTAHFFLVAGLVGARSDWLMAECGWDFPLFDWDTARDLERSGFFCGAHTLTHPRLAEISAEKARCEIEESRSILEEKLDREIRHFAYPFGSFNEDTRCMVKCAGFRSSCSVWPSLSRPGDDPFALNRVHVTRTDSQLGFRVGLATGRSLGKWWSGVNRRLRRYAGRPVGQN